MDKEQEQEWVAGHMRMRTSANWRSAPFCEFLSHCTVPKKYDAFV